jgi:hypothetical protein
MDKNCTDLSFFYSKIPKNFGLNSLTRSKFIALLIFTKFPCDLLEVPHFVYIIDERNVKNGTMGFKIITLIISAFRNSFAKLHLNSLHHSG